ncbi:MAG: tRNA dihydrouridine synthase DusB [Vulcanimicrobiota bacterium]
MDDHDLLVIGALKCHHKVIAAPMAGITDLPFRLIARKYHSGLLSTEMLSSQSLVHRHKRTLSMLNCLPEEHPLSIQLLGRDPDKMAESAKIVEAAGADIIDINMGCSVRKVISQGEGAALLREPEEARRVIEAVVHSVQVPVTVKMRKGFSKNDKSCLLIARIAQDAGVRALIIHGRTSDQGFSGEADWEITSEMKRVAAIPVIGNGDIKSPHDAREMMRKTGCDGIMVGRAMLGNPWILKTISMCLKSDSDLETCMPSLDEIFEIAGFHIRYAREVFGDISAYNRIRKHLAWYLKGQPLSARMREMIFRTESFDDLELQIRNYHHFLLTLEEMRAEHTPSFSGMESLFSKMVSEQN